MSCQDGAARCGDRILFDWLFWAFVSKRVSVDGDGKAAQWFGDRSGDSQGGKIPEIQTLSTEGKVKRTKRLSGTLRITMLCVF